MPPSPTGKTRLWIGPSGWSYPDWNGTVYPAPRPRGFKPLAFLARFVNAVEVNTSFYQIPTPRMTSAWPAQTPADFRFAFKLTRIFTHERGEMPAAPAFRAFGEALRPVRDAGKLGPVLVQFPWSFRFNAENAEWLARLADGLRESGCQNEDARSHNTRRPRESAAIEVRHSSWLRDEGRAAVARAGVWCNIDQPALRDCIGPTAAVGDSFAYVRLHGRNAAMWFAENVPPFERYNYLYDDRELREWVERLNRIVRDLDSRAGGDPDSPGGDAYVFTNNHYRGQAVANALELRAMLQDAPLPAPDPLRVSYPRLAAITRGDIEPGLFDR